MTLKAVDDRPPAGDRWGTPDKAFRALHAEFGFTVDAAAEAHNAKLPRFFQDGLRASWRGERVFCNPPYSRILPWVRKAQEAEVAVLVLPVRTGVPWWHLIWDNDSNAPRPGWRLRFVRGRMRFKGARSTPTWDTVLAIWSPP